MKGFISSWKSGGDKLTTCEGDVFPFDLDGVIDGDLSQWLQRSSGLEDSGPCPGKVPVRFVTQGGFAVDITRLNQQMSWREFDSDNAGAQPMRAVNRIPVSAGALSLGGQPELASHAATALQIHHPKGNKSLRSTLHVSLQKPKDARVVMTIHHGAKTTTAAFPFGKKVAGKQKIRIPMTPQPGMGGVHHVSVHTFVQRKKATAKVKFKVHSLEVRT